MAVEDAITELDDGIVDEETITELDVGTADEVIAELEDKIVDEEITTELEVDTADEAVAEELDVEDGIIEDEVEEAPQPPMRDGTALTPVPIATRFVPQFAALARRRF